MALGSYESRLRPWIDRLEKAKVVVDGLTAEKANLELVQALKSGSFDEGDLERLYGFVDAPLRAAVVVGMAVSQECAFSRLPELGEDPFCRTLDLLARSEYRPTNERELPVIDLTADAEDLGLGRRDAIRVGLVRRLVRRDGIERLQTMVRRALDEGRFRFPHLNGEEVERLLRLASWIEKSDSVPIFRFMDQDGRVGSTYLERAGVCVVDFV